MRYIKIKTVIEAENLLRKEKKIVHRGISDNKDKRILHFYNINNQLLSSINVFNGDMIIY